MTAFINILLLLLDLAVIIAGGLVLDSASRRLLPARGGRVRAAARPVIFCFVMSMPSWIGDENMLIMLPFFLGMFILCYGGTLPARIITGVIFYISLLPLNMMIDSTRFFSGNFESTGFIIRLLYYVLINLLLRRAAREGKPINLPGQMWAMCGVLCLSPLFAILSFTFWYSADGIVYESHLRLAFTLLPFVLLSGCALLFTLVALSRRQELEQEHQLAGMRELYYENLQLQQSGLRTLKHDLRNHLTALQGLLAEGGTARAQAYLEELAQSPALHGVRRICENDMANVVLSGKLEQMESMGLVPDVLVTLPASLPIADVDLCALLGNALDNAIEAAAKAEGKTITIRMRADRGMLMLKVQNACAEAPVSENGLFKSTKPDGEAHGFGITGMREIVGRYGGVLRAGAENGLFELVACLPVAE